MPQPSGPFTYVFIPSEASSPIEARVGDKSGGLSDDYLAKAAKSFFFEQSGGAARAAAFDNATPEERKQIARQIREQVSSADQDNNATNQMSKLDDDALINIVRTTQTSETCEIIALTVPTKANGHLAVSMYGADDARNRDLPPNPRATALMSACGHAVPPPDEKGPGGVRGDVFVGRCHDDESGDVWERVDFDVDDADPDAGWCKVARDSGGGGGRGSTSGGAPPSLSGVMQNALEGGEGGMQSGSPMAALSGTEINGGGYRWSQNAEEVELKFPVARGTKAKYVKVNFGPRSLKVTAAGQTLANGATGGKVAVDECTYTIQDERESGTGRELCVTLGKADGTAWNYAVERA